VGSFASGSDVARELASVALPTDSLPESMQLARKRNHHDHPDVAPKGKVEVFQSSSMLPNDMSSFGKEATEKSPWIKLIEHRPLIEKMEGGVIYFNNGSTLENIDVIIFATGYYYFFPFFKTSDYPWSEQDNRVCDETVGEVDVVDEINGWEKDGLQGLAMQGLDELKLFLKADRTCAFIALRELRIREPSVANNEMEALDRPIIYFSLFGRSLPLGGGPVPFDRAVLVRTIAEYAKAVFAPISGGCTES
jgi:hypothetical protein